MKLSFLRILGLVIAGLVTMISLALAGAQASDIAGYSVQWPWIALSGFVLFVGQTAIWLLNQTSKIRSFENRRPYISVTPQHEGKKAWFAVRNEGPAVGNFAMHVQVGGTDKGRMDFHARWHAHGDEREYRIMGGDQAAIGLVETQGVDSERFEGLNLWAVGHNLSARMPIGRELRCEVQVFSEPKLRTPFNKAYLLELGKDGLWSNFKETTDTT